MISLSCRGFCYIALALIATFAVAQDTRHYRTRVASEEMLDQTLFTPEFTLESFLAAEDVRINSFLGELSPAHLNNKVEGVKVEDDQLIISGEYFPQLIATRYILSAMVTVLLDENGRITPGKRNLFQDLLLNRGMSPKEINLFLAACENYDFMTFHNEGMRGFKSKSIKFKSGKLSDAMISNYIKNYKNESARVGNLWLKKVLEPLTDQGKRVVISLLHEKYLANTTSFIIFRFSNPKRIAIYREKLSEGVETR